MSPEERARALIIDEPDFPEPGTGYARIHELLVKHIKQAENDALERAARVIECGCDKFHGGACQVSANCAKDDQEAIRDLKHKD